jgi:hypothetical protein
MGITESKQTSPVEISTVSQEALAPVTQTQPDDDGFDEAEDFAEITQEQQFTPSAVAGTKPKQSLAGFGGLLANLKNSLSGLGGLGKGKTKPVETTKATQTSLTDAGIPIYPTVDLDDILESKAVESVPEVVAETPISLTKSSDPMSAEATESMATEVTESITAEAKKETVRSPDEITAVTTTENLTATVDAMETETPTPPVEIAKMVSVTSTEPLSVGETSEPEKAESTESWETLTEVPAVEVKSEAGSEAKLVHPNESEHA